MTDLDRLKHCAARWCWPRRDDRTPSGSATWAQWFRERYGESLFEYRERVKR